jgi:hypothetical protein
MYLTLAHQIVVRGTPLKYCETNGKGYSLSSISDASLLITGRRSTL